MRHLGPVAGVAIYVLLSACTDYATFVTSTDIGINLDAKTEQLNIGYARAELFHGPGYPDKGAAPSAFGYISSDLSVFSPNVKQLYATGEAAELVTQHDAPPTTAEKADTLAGYRRPLFFGTGTSFGLRVGFAGDVPSSVKVGFNREEVSIIPMQQKDPLTGEPDKYASVLASINTDNTIASPSGTHIRPTQFFATGAAARNLAKREEIRDIYEAQAKTAVQEAALTEAVEAIKKKAESNSDAISKYFAKIPDAQFEAERDALFNRTGLPAGDREFIRLKKMTKDQFISYMKQNSGTSALLARHLPNDAK